MNTALLITFAMSEKKKKRNKLFKRMAMGLGGAAALYGGTAAARAILDVKKHNKETEKWANEHGIDLKKIYKGGYLPRFKHRLLHPLSK